VKWPFLNPFIFRDDGHFTYITKLKKKTLMLMAKEKELNFGGQTN
jgi:hypothetical protein